MAKLFFLDIEASSLDSGTFPIEIAWVDIHGQGTSYLIQPQWNWTEWSTASQHVHGITREQLLQEGYAASWVAEQAWAALNGAVICSDNPQFDQYWLSMLLGVKGLPTLSVIELTAVMGSEIRRVLTGIDENTPEAHDLLRQGQLYSSQQTEIEAHRPRIRHRAMPDAQGMWWCWWKVKDWVDRRLEVLDTPLSRDMG